MYLLKELDTTQVNAEVMLMLCPERVKYMYVPLLSVRESVVTFHWHWVYILASVAPKREHTIGEWKS